MIVSAAALKFAAICLSAIAVTGIGYGLLSRTAPFTSNDDNQAAAETTATASPSAMPSTATPPSEVTPTATPTVHATSTLTAPAPRVDANGWPVLDCPTGTSEYRVTTRRITFCAPDRWVVNEQDSKSNPSWDGVYVAYSVNAFDPSEPARAFEFQLISRQSRGDRSNYDPGCLDRSVSNILGQTADRCDATASEPNGTPFHPAYTWYTHFFVEGKEMFITAAATGTDASVTAERDLLVGALQTMVHNGLAEVPR